MKHAGGAGLHGSRAFPREVVDTTGAGDSFVAGFLTGVLTEMGIEKERRLRMRGGGAEYQRKVGATAGIPTFDEARNFMESNGG